MRGHVVSLLLLIACAVGARGCPPLEYTEAHAAELFKRDWAGEGAQERMAQEVEQRASALSHLMLLPDKQEKLCTLLRETQLVQRYLAARGLLTLPAVSRSANAVLSHLDFLAKLVVEDPVRALLQSRYSCRHQLSHRA